MSDTTDKPQDTEGEPQAIEDLELDAQTSDHVSGGEMKKKIGQQSGERFK
ncbi:MAG TPA: hypothetical protein VLJ76_02785 [Gaiellaceae bacterium]|nr:hypothetical protein [Gaiellaceae bacterium]